MLEKIKDIGEKISGIIVAIAFLIFNVALVVLAVSVIGGFITLCLGAN